MNPAYDGVFDPDLIMHINSTFSILHQLGVGPAEGFAIHDDSSVWSDFVTDTRLEMVKSYITAKCKLIFDPPASATVMDAYKSYIDEFEWRLNVAVDPGESE